MCMVNRLQICGICGGDINSPIRMSNHISCEEDARDARRQSPSTKHVPKKKAAKR